MLLYHLHDRPDGEHQEEISGPQTRRTIAEVRSEPRFPPRSTSAALTSPPPEPSPTTPQESGLARPSPRHSEPLKPSRTSIPGSSLAASESRESRLCSPALTFRRWDTSASNELPASANVCCGCPRTTPPWAIPTVWRYPVWRAVITSPGAEATRSPPRRVQTMPRQLEENSKGVWQRQKTGRVSTRTEPTPHYPLEHSQKQHPLHIRLRWEEAKEQSRRRKKKSNKRPTGQDQRRRAVRHRGLDRRVDHRRHHRWRRRSRRHDASLEHHSEDSGTTLLLVLPSRNGSHLHGPWVRQRTGWRTRQQADDYDRLQVINGETCHSTGKPRPRLRH